MKKLILALALLTLSTHLVNGQVSFTASDTTGCAPLQITFTNTSTSGTTYNWYMGDGTTYNNQTNVTHTYSQSGWYWVDMYAYNSFGSYIGMHSQQIQVTGPPQEIYMNSDEVCPGDEIDMSAYMQDATGWSWDFGDGNTASGYDYVEHTYSSTGTYYPTVTITSPCGIYTVQDTITVTNSIPYFGNYPYISVSVDTVCPGSMIQGWTSTGWSSYNWDYGDGNTDSGDQVEWSYASTGNYTVTLTITNGCGVDTNLTDQVVVSNTAPVENPYFQVPDTICPNETWDFYAGANGNTNVVLDMGDGSPIVNDSWTEHSYSSAGVYYPTATIINDCGNSVTITDTVYVSNNAPILSPYFDINPQIVCPGDKVDFWSNYEYSYYVDFGDGNGQSSGSGNIDHEYDSPGIYTVTSTIQNSCGNSVTLVDTVSVQDNLPINPNDVYAYVWPDPACPGSEVEFDASYGYSNYSWDFDDGTNGSGQNIDHIYNTPGSYTATVLIENGCGSQATASVSVDIQDNLPMDDAYIYMQIDTICPGDAVFMQSDNGEEGYTYLWDLGDGTTASGFGVSHSYANTGVFPISLTVTNGCGNDSTAYDTIVVSDSYVPSTSDYQAFVTNEGCVGDELSFVLIPAGAGDILWDFGDGDTTSVVDQVFVQGVANVDVSSHIYTQPGTYWASYTITNACGNSITDSVEVTIGGPGDNINANVDLLYDQSQSTCQGAPIEFMTFGGGTYIWNFGDGSGQLVTNTPFAPVYHTYQDAGTYTVQVQMINGCGNTDDSDENITIPPSAIDVSTNTVTESNCGENNGLAVVSASGGIPPYNYSWTNGDSGVIADSLSSGIYVVTVTDINDCSNEGIATVSDVEGVTILVDNVVNVDCYGEENGSISVSILGGQPPYDILWSNGDQTEDIYGLQAGPYEIFVTDANGCFAVESIEVTQPAKSNVSVITTKATCGGNNGSAIASVNNGTGPFNYIWPNATGPSNQTGGLSPGMHELLVIDGNTCLLKKDFAINETGSPIIITDSTYTGTCNGDLSDIYISTIGGSQPFTYNWSNGNPSQDLEDVLPGEYTVEVSGSNGCSSYASYTVAEGTPDQPEICMVDVDTTTGSNLIVWSPLNDPGVDAYNIYKESSEAGLYYLIGNQSSDSLSQYFDYQSDPSIRSWRYKIAAVDDCGNESEWSDHHKTIHLTSNQGINGEVNLIWDDYEGFDYSTFYVNRWHPTTGWEILDSLASNSFSFTDQTPPSDSNLVYMITINTPNTCTATEATDYNSSRSNTEGINMPQDTTGSTAGVEENFVDLTIYPNPTNDVVRLKYTNSINEVRLYDISGKLIYTTNANGMKTLSIDMNYFESGIYLIDLETNEGTLRGKIIKE